MALPGHIDLNDLVVFAAVADTGGFSKAALRLGDAPAKGSLEVARLETRLGTALFTRTTRRVVPTEAGRALHEECAPLLLQLRAAIDDVHASAAALTGSLRVTAPTDFGAHFVAPALARFGIAVGGRGGRGQAERGLGLGQGISARMACSSLSVIFRD